MFIRTLVVAGAGAGIAATFFAHLAAVFFARGIVLGGFGAALAYALARRFQPGSAYTFALPGEGVHLKPGAFMVERPQE